MWAVFFYFRGVWVRVRLVYRQQGAAGQTLFENVDCDSLEFLPLDDTWNVDSVKGKRVLFINPLEVASVTVDGAAVALQPAPVVVTP